MAVCGATIESVEHLRVVFLDVDGVLHPKDAVAEVHGLFWPVCCQRLQQIAHDARATVVLRSARTANSNFLEYVSARLRRYGISLHGTTPSGGKRSCDNTALVADDIFAWLQLHRDVVEDFVVLCDTDLSCAFGSSHCITTSPQTGLSDENVRIALEHFYSASSCDVDAALDLYGKCLLDISVLAFDDKLAVAPAWSNKRSVLSNLRIKALSAISGSLCPPLARASASLARSGFQEDMSYARIYCQGIREETGLRECWGPLLTDDGSGGSPPIWWEERSCLRSQPKDISLRNVGVNLVPSSVDVSDRSGYLQGSCRLMGRLMHCAAMSELKAA